MFSLHKYFLAALHKRSSYFILSTSTKCWKCRFFITVCYKSLTFTFLYDRIINRENKKVFAWLPSCKRPPWKMLIWLPSYQRKHKNCLLTTVHSFIIFILHHVSQKVNTQCVSLSGCTKNMYWNHKFSTKTIMKDLPDVKWIVMSLCLLLIVWCNRRGLLFS